MCSIIKLLQQPDCHLGVGENLASHAELYSVTIYTY